MQTHERKAFLKFFLLYFVSVAVLILVSGFIYFDRVSQTLLKGEHFSMIDYARVIKMEDEPPVRKGLRFETIEKTIPNFDIQNFELKGHYFIKYIPTSLPNKYIKITKEQGDYQKRRLEIRQKVLMVQIALLSFFALLSYILAKNAIRPLQDSIIKLDKFAKDIIHDLNTPITSIGLNFRLLKNEISVKGEDAINRIQQSLDNISTLHTNLKILLQEETFQVEEQNVCVVVDTVIAVYKELYPSLHIENNCHEMFIKTNKQALQQIIDNLLSNACKYNVENGTVLVQATKRCLVITNDSQYIENSSKLFDRNYKEQVSGTGIGLDIVKRLCESLDINIAIYSKDEITTVTLTFT